MIPEGPLLWYVNRSTGLVLLVLLTLALVLGAVATAGRAGGWIPRFAVQALHRNLALLSVALLAVHVASAVVDEYVDIRWWQAFLPRDLRYEPVWLAVGVVALDVLVAVVVTSLVRHRLARRWGYRGWWLLHLTTYAAWGASVVHGLGIGTDTGQEWVRWTYAGCGLAVLLGVAVRAGVVLSHRRQRRRQRGRLRLPVAAAPAAGAPR